MKVIIVLIWVVVFVLIFLFFVVYNIKKENEVEICYLKFEGSFCIKMYLIVNFVVFVVMFLIIMIILYFVLSVKFWLKKLVGN